MEIYEELHDDCGICFTKKEIGAFYKYIEHYDEALKYLYQAQAMLPKVLRESPTLTSHIDNRVYTHIAESYMRKKLFGKELFGKKDTVSLDSIKKYVKLSLFTKDMDDSYGTCRTLFVQSMAQYDVNPRDAVFNLAACLEYAADTVNIPYMEASFFYADYLCQQKSYAQAKKYALLCYHRALATGKKQYVVRSSDLLYQIYSALEPPRKILDSALFYLTEKEVFTDSIIDYYKAEQVEIRTTEQNLKEAKEAEEEAHLEKEIQNIVFWTVIIGAISCLIFLVYYRLRTTANRSMENQSKRLIIFFIFVAL